jgi:hypothetical protein
MCATGSQPQISLTRFFVSVDSQFSSMARHIGYPRRTGRARCMGRSFRPGNSVTGPLSKDTAPLCEIVGPHARAA